ncbi:uncharacterized protein EV154DRAFT_601540 [Mucor mucedo]|uniref:uncharacterized protein n=1 Tax=Mucor mucedo TaxID=29922 RepID=UPI00221EED9A|nr:uncharacterized protein EV154DRAFT_601540 [Mucor mucedo]KAI7892666.1 hypothetical protein EV154DRAFT_601540 [Mucor mucedo]
MHQLNHITFIIKQCSILRCVSVRSMEREIGAYKKKMRSRVNAGENANNIMERTALFSFMRNTKMVNFDPTPPKLETDFVEHPSGNVDFGQLWAPFYQEFELTGNADNDCLIAGDLLTMKSFVSALKSYKKRFFSLPEPIHRIQINVESILPAGKLWQDSHVYSAAIFKQGLSKSIAKRGGEHVLFHSNHQTRRRGRISQVTNWYVGRLLFFFEYAFDETSSFYAVLEVMKRHSAASHSPCIPTVVPYENNEEKKIVVINIADIVTVVGLLKMVTHSVNGKKVTYQDSSSLFVISPSTSFDDDMKKTAGKISNLC